MYQLYIANKNYSSWSLRIWVLLKELNIPFEEIRIPFTGIGEFRDHKDILPSKKVPTLHDQDLKIWDSLSIVEYLFEKGHSVYPNSLKKRTIARSYCAEMHSGFHSLRSVCSMNCGIRVHLNEISQKLEKDIAKINDLLSDALNENKGDFLYGNQFNAADAFFAPIAFRMQTYDLKFDSIVQDYFQILLELPSMKEWYQDAINETMRDIEHDQDVIKYGTIIKDLRKK